MTNPEPSKLERALALLREVERHPDAPLDLCVKARQFLTSPDPVPEIIADDPFVVRGVAVEKRDGVWMYLSEGYGLDYQDCWMPVESSFAFGSGSGVLFDLLHASRSLLSEHECEIERLNGIIRGKMPPSDRARVWQLIDSALIGMFDNSTRGEVCNALAPLFSKQNRNPRAGDERPVLDDISQRVADVIAGLHGVNLPATLPVLIQELKVALERFNVSREPESCVWVGDEETGAYATACGHTWHLADGETPEEHGQFYCHHCGKQIDAGQFVPSLSHAAEADPADHLTYITRPSESLAGIALRQLNDQARWVEIRDLNSLIFSEMGPNDYYPVGTSIKLPAADGPEATPVGLMPLLGDEHGGVQ